jgi:RNA polymerase sigma-70 factor (ECF subfamily)
VTLNKWRDRCRRLAAVPKTTDIAHSHVADLVEPRWYDETEYRHELVGRAMQMLQPEFQPATWQAFWQSAVAGRRGREVAAELGLTVNAVYLARSRVLRRLREELSGLLD